MDGEKVELREYKRRQYTGKMAVLVKVISVLLPLYCFFNVLNIAGLYLGVLFYPESFRALFLAMVLTLIFLLYPASAGAPKNRLPWYDLLFIIASWVPTTYIFFIAPEIIAAERVGAEPFEQALFILLLVVLSESIRRVVGVAVLMIAFISLVYANFAYLLPGLWGAPRFSLERLTEYIYLFQSGIFGTVLGIAGTTIITFVTFGQFLMKAGTATLLMDSAFSLAGRYRGGPAKVAVLASAGMATISGSAIANVGTSGSLTIPMMKKLGYRPHFAAAVETIASTGGVITPPMMGSVAFIMADVTGLGYRAVVLASILPAILYYVCLYFQVDFESAKLNLVGLPPKDLPSFKGAVKERGHLIIPVLLLVFLLMVLRMDVHESVMYSIAVMLLVSWIRKSTRMTLGKILDALSEGGRAVLMVAPITAAAGIIMGAVSLTGLGVNLAALIRNAAGGNIWLLAVFTWLALYFSGMAVGEIILYIVMSIVIVPAFVSMGAPVLAAHMFIFWMSVSMFITPPNCPAVFVACSIAGSEMWRTAYTSMRLGIVAFLLPFVFLLNPALLLLSTPGKIVLATVTSIIGAFFLAAGIEGFLIGKLKKSLRILLIIGSLGLFLPGWRTDVLGIFLAIPLWDQYKVWKTKRAGRQV
ncbi:MAG: TRAP transporter fused permease subunit [Desulfobacterales bacterium]|nr:TRAP transporter fused permease subunit [Desulfobacterales bacterium]